MAQVDIPALQAGDELAFGEAWRALHPRLLRFLRGLGAGRDAEDHASTAWLEVVRHVHRFEGDERDFRAWLFTIARNRMVDARRRSARRPEVLTPEVAVAVESSDPDPAEIGEQRVSTESALDLVRTLPPDQAEVVLLRVLADLDVPAVARIVGKSTGAVRVLAHRGLKNLAAEIQRREPHGGARSATLEGVS